MWLRASSPIGEERKKWPGRWEGDMGSSGMRGGRVFVRGLGGRLCLEAAGGRLGEVVVVRVGG